MLHLDARGAAAPYAWIDPMQVPNADPYAPRSQRPLSHGDRIERAHLDRATAREMVNAGSMPVSLYVQMFGVDRQEVMPRLHVQKFVIDGQVITRQEITRQKTSRQEISCLDQAEH